MSLPPILKDKLRLPIVGSPLFIISNPDLVIAQCKAGIVGSFPALNARPQAMLDEWLARIKEELAELDRKTALCVESTRKLYPHAGFTSDLLRELASKKPA